MSTVTEQIEKAITKHGSTRDALNVALAQLEADKALMERARWRTDVLWDALEKIRNLAFSEGLPAGVLRQIDDVACSALAYIGGT